MDARHLTDLIYAALLGERDWQDFLAGLAGLLPNGRGILLFHDSSSRIGTFALNSGLDGDTVAAYGAHYAKVNPWMRGATTRQTGRVVRADSMVPFDRLAKTEFFTDFLSPLDLQSGIGVTIVREQSCNFMISVLAAAAVDPVYDKAIATVQELTPHLRRAFSWYRGSGGAESGLLGGAGLGESSRAGVLRVGPGRKVRAASRAAEEILKASTVLSIDRHGRLQCRRAAVVDYVDSVLSSWLRSDSAAAVRSFLLLADEAGMPMRLTVIPPVHKPAEAFFRGPECIVLLERPGGNVGFAAREFGALYGLSAAETRVVAGLAHGRTPEEIAAHGCVAVDTVRKQIKSIFLRTGLRRQSDIVRSVCLLAGTVLHPADGANSE